MKSNVRLHLSDQALLKFSTDVNLYFPAVPTRWEGIDCNNTHPLIYAYGETNIALTGRGTLDAQGSRETWWGRGSIERRNHYVNPADSTSREIIASRVRLFEWGENQVPMHERIYTVEDGMRPQFINFCHCTTVLIEGITLLNSPFWVIHPLLCNDLIVRGVTVNNHGPNGDGCDPESCRNVLIEDCVFNTGDDCIAIKSGRNTDGRKWNIPSENIVVRRCKMADGHGGVVIGSEISGGFRNLFVEDCMMDSPNLDRVIRIKTSTARGGIIENIYVRNIEVGQCRESVLHINLNYEPNEKARRGFNPLVRNVNMENVNCRKSLYGVYFSVLENEANIQDIRLQNCRLEGVTTGGNYVKGQIGTVTFDRVTINGKAVKTLSPNK
jgi:polygalacturonase